MPPPLQQFLWDEIVPQRLKMKSFAHILIPDNSENRSEKKKDSQRLAEHRLIPFPKDHTISLEILLYEDMVAFMSFTKEEMFGLVLDSPAINHTLKSIFLYVWESVKSA